MTNEEVVETQLEKIRKLLAKAESTTLEEAEALTEKATQLMMRYAIDEAMLGTRSDKIETVIEKRIEMTKTMRRANAYLAHRVGAACGLRTIQNTWKHNTITVYLIGFESDVERAELIITSLMVQGVPALKAFWKAKRESVQFLSTSQQFTVKRSFLMGFYTAAAKKMKASSEEAKKEAAAESDDAVRFSNSLAVALRDRDKLVDDWVDKTYGRLRTGRSVRISATGWQEGKVAGSAADVGSPSVSSNRLALNA